MLASGQRKKYRETMHTPQYRMVVAAVLTTVLMVGFVSKATAVSASGVMFVELQTAGAGDAGAEFVKISNQSASPVSVEGWKLQYRSATGTSWTTKATLVGELSAQGNLMLATSAYGASSDSLVMQDGLAQAGGHVQLVDATGMVHDIVGWGTAIAAEGTAAPAPEKEQSLIRNSSAGMYTDTDNNLADFHLEVMPLPPPSPPPASPPAAASKPAVLGSTIFNQGLLPPHITELLPNPSSPQTDANDEFIELYNPNAEPFSLTKYKLQTGTTFSSSVTLADRQIPARGYLVITSADTSLSLSNTAGGARLIDPEAKVIAESAAYDEAAAGQAWAFIDGEWRWTTSPTPGAANLLALSDAEEESSRTTGTSDNQSVKAAKSNKSSSNSSDVTEEPAKSPSIHLIIIALVASLAVGYAIYEYRHDLGNLIYRLRAYREDRRSHRQTAARR
ncbi:MAG: lamin tail domain-containing protein [Candidatus Saccharibacteria bacterium]|nr:lamin tail domain-containing protein [Candidatus Saccharibacteria bacterium]